MEQMRFKISSALKDLIGKDLITNDNVAIFELVKNSYDAYATKVEITFEEDKIIIADNGKGMTFNDVRDKWLFLGFSAKKDGSEDSDIKNVSYRDNIKRHYAGAKGIGRFSCDRLGKRLLLSTKSSLSSHIEQIYVDWERFEQDQKTEFAQINVEYARKETGVLFPNNGTTGTVLEISSLDKKSIWTRKKILELKRSLEKLINPLSETNDFEIEIICKRELEKDNEERANNKHDRDIVNGILKNSISSILNIKTTLIDIELNGNQIYTKIVDRGVNIYKISENNIHFSELKDVRISLYYLNRSAKVNFTKLMGVEPVNYGSIFLFRNGFRIMPFGAPSDDSWSLDYRAQQGNRRFLGTRDLFGRVDIITDNVEDLKEVSSRDGGLIETDVSKQLFELFKIAHRRLERYVSGVLWGEAFLRRDYFHDEMEANEERRKLLEADKMDETPDYVFSSSIGSKIDFIQLIKTLTKDNNVEVIYYNKELANILSNPQVSEEIKPQFIADLEKIAIEMNDSDLLFNIDEAKRKILELQKANELAEQKAIEAERKRIEAEEKARLAEIAKKEAERRREEEEEQKKIAQLQAKEAELRRREEEIKRKEAEQQKIEEEEKRKRAEEDKKRVEIERDVEKSKNKYLVSTRNITKEAEDILHTIKISSNELSAAAKNISRELESISQSQKIREDLDYIFFHVERINKLSKLLTKADIAILKEHTKTDIAEYIQEYLPNYKSTLEEITFHKDFTDVVIKKIPILDLSVILDNLINNSIKAGASKIHIDFAKDHNQLIVDFSDNGLGVDLEKFSSDAIFELGITNKRGGSGIGLNTIKETMKRELKGDIVFLGNGLHYERGATFRLTFR
ncbi:sensor histidine kinase [Bacteroides salyersiae]|jgi:hypothetical protein|uniref:sensor histidine kinase n=2 Tax=Bacteroides TaxID=816 RepID=UPI0021AB33D9|nr:sensor histidine kinase [Bacteroides salyersiae]